MHKPQISAAVSPPRPQVVGLTAIAYIPALLSMMTVGVIVPFIGRLTSDLGASGAQIGFAIALFSMPTAILATMGGGFVDRYGVRPSLIAAGAVAALASGLASRAGTLAGFDACMLLAGLGYGGICIAAPALLMSALREGARVRAMSFLSTYPPTGYAGGLLLAVPFVDAGQWRTALQLHSGLMLLATVAMFIFVPRHLQALTETRARKPALGDVLGILREPRVLFLGLAVALPNAVSYGTSLAAPAFLAKAHGLSLAASSANVALAKIVAMMVGGVSTGYLLSRAVSTRWLFTAMVAVGICAQTLLFIPIGGGIALATGALVLWLFAFGGMVGGAMGLLPSLLPDGARSGAASGVVNQFISLASFAAPSTWLALHAGPQFVGLAALCLIVSLVALLRAAP